MLDRSGGNNKESFKFTQILTFTYDIDIEGHPTNKWMRENYRDSQTHRGEGHGKIMEILTRPEV